mgnify:CR=1 FL=1
MANQENLIEPVVREAFKDLLKEVIDLLMRVTRVSVETQAIVEAMRKAAR